MPWTFNPFTGKLDFSNSAGGGTDTNITTGTVSAATAARAIDFATFDLTFNNIGNHTLDVQGEFTLTAHDNVQHFFKSLTSGTQHSWFLRANDGTEGVTLQMIADATNPQNSQIELGTGATGAPVLIDTDSYFQIDGQAAQSGEFRIEAISGQHFVAQKVNTTTAGASSYTIVWPNAEGSVGQGLRISAVDANDPNTVDLEFYSAPGVEVIDQLAPTAQNTVPNISNAAQDISKVKFFVNGSYEAAGITVNASQVVSVNALTLGYNIETTDSVTAIYFA